MAERERIVAQGMVYCDKKEAKSEVLSVEVYEADGVDGFLGLGEFKQGTVYHRFRRVLCSYRDGARCELGGKCGLGG